MSFFASYLLARLGIRIADFFRHWYLGGLERISGYVFALFEALEQTIALRVTIRYFATPLYGDWTPVGRVLGPLFRLGRIILGLIVYPIVFIGGAIAYFIWAAIPAYLIFELLTNV